MWISCCSPAAFKNSESFTLIQNCTASAYENNWALAQDSPQTRQPAGLFRKGACPQKRLLLPRATHTQRKPAWSYWPSCVCFSLLHFSSFIYLLLYRDAPLFFTSMFTAIQGRRWRSPLCRLLLSKHGPFFWGPSQVRAEPQAESQEPGEVAACKEFC